MRLKKVIYACFVVFLLAPSWTFAMNPQGSSSNKAQIPRVTNSPDDELEALARSMMDDEIALSASSSTSSSSSTSGGHEGRHAHASPTSHPVLPNLAGSSALSHPDDEEEDEQVQQVLGETLPELALSTFECEVGATGPVPSVVVSSKSSTSSSSNTSGISRANSPRHYVYIVIPSGGMLGFIPAYLLQNLEMLTGKRISQMVEGMFAISTGAIISALLSVVRPGQTRPYTAQEVVGFYEKQGNLLFKQAIENIVKKFTGQAVNQLTVLRDPLRERYADARLSNALIHLGIVSFNQNSRQMHTFDSHALGEDRNLDVLIADAVWASASVAQVFGQAQFQVGGQEQSFVDPGSQGVPHPLSDPTSLLVSQLQKRLGPSETATIYFLGTGFLPSGRKPIEQQGPIQIVSIEPNLKDLRTANFLYPFVAPFVGAQNALGALASTQELQPFAQALLDESENYANMVLHFSAIAAELADENEEALAQDKAKGSGGKGEI